MGKLGLLKLSVPQAAVSQCTLLEIVEQADILWLWQRKPQFVQENVFHHSIDICDVPNRHDATPQDTRSKAETKHWEPEVPGT
jgi:5,10-methylene-tetrahydrofolate dehydrogenase/methenyl tetrahydrofolate cyclohydrolase